jgi:hypothetical protein
MLFHVVNIVNHRPQLHDTSIITAYIRRKVPTPERTRACSGSSDTPVDVSSLSPVDRGLERTYWQDTGCKRVSGYEARIRCLSEAPSYAKRPYLQRYQLHPTGLVFVLDRI